MATDTIGCAQCRCGAVSLEIYSPPKFRVICHCSICQSFNDAPFGDILVFSARNVAQADPGSIHFKRWRSPPSVRRGRCARCDHAALELFNAGPLANLAMIPTANVTLDAPDPFGHIFYESRVADVDDALPKHHGYWASQWAFMRNLFRRPR